MTISEERAACIDVPELPLQLLLRSEPGWVQEPVVVVADDRPQAEVLWANDIARRSRIQPGMSYAAAQSLEARVRAGVVGPDRIDATIEEIVERLKEFSPRIEAARRPLTPSEEVQGVPGTFWLDPAGMVPLFTSFEHWGHAIRHALEAMGLRSTIVVGFHRFRCRALARVRHGVWVLDDPRAERRATDQVPLRALTMPAKTRKGLDRLEIRTLGQLLALPPHDLRARFGEAAAHLYACASDGWAPMRPRELVEPVAQTKSVEPPDDDRSRLLFLVKSMLHDLMVELADRSQAMTSLSLRLRLDHADPHQEELEPAHPTLDELMVTDLVRLRLDALTLDAPVEEIELELRGVRAAPGQLAMFRTQSRRDLDGAARALARLRAWLGPEAVTRGRLRTGHLPEARFEWEPITTIGFAFPKARGSGPVTRPETVDIAAADPERAPPHEPVCMVRRMLPRPQRIPPLPIHDPDDERIVGSHRVSGGWWNRRIERDYCFVETESGELLWVYYDRERRGWFQQGRME